jgi:hypothetical protein
MKRFNILLALLVALVLGAAPAHAAYTVVLNGVTTATASSIIPTGGASNVEVYLNSAAGSTSTVTIELCAQNLAATCYIVATISNVAAAGDWYTGPSGPYFRINGSAVTSGAVTALYGTNNGPRLDTWKQIKMPAVAGAGTLTLTTLTASGTVTGATLASTGGITAATTVAATGGVSGTTGTFSAGLSGTTGTFTGAISGTTLTGSGGVAGTTGTFSALTATRIPYAGTAGLLQDLANFTYTTATGAIVNTAGTAPSISTNRFLSTGTAPTTDAGASTCGTSAPSIAGKDQVGVITVGSVSGTVCHVNFNVTWANAPVCNVTGSSATDLKVSTSTTILTITGTLTAAEKLYYTCLGY